VCSHLRDATPAEYKTIAATGVRLLRERCAFPIGVEDTGQVACRGEQGAGELAADDGLISDN
jgi:hypothetical protein